MTRQKPRRVVIPTGVFGDLIMRGRSFFSPAQLKYALSQIGEKWADMESNFGGNSEPNPETLQEKLGGSNKFCIGMQATDLKCFSCKTPQKSTIEALMRNCFNCTQKCSGEERYLTGKLKVSLETDIGEIKLGEYTLMHPKLIRDEIENLLLTDRDFSIVNKLDLSAFSQKRQDQYWNSIFWF